jgi:translation initiation factor IF-3
VPAVRVISEDGEALGVMDVRDAVQRARSIGLDLVEIAPNADPPVCKIIDYGKFLYDQKKKAHEAKKKQVTVTVKEIKFRPATDNHDYEYRLERAKEWLSGGDKVRATISFRGREMSHRELGAKILARLREDLAEYGDPEVLPKMEGYQMFMIMVPKKGKMPPKPVKKEKPAEKADGKAEKAAAKPAPKPEDQPAEQPVENQPEESTVTAVEAPVETDAESAAESTAEETAPVPEEKV